MKKVLLLVFFSVVIGTSAFSQDRIFTHTYQSNVLPYSSTELEYSGMLRSGRSEFYNAFDHRLELELGLGKNWQTAFYINLSREVHLGTNEHGLKDLLSEVSSGFSNEWKWKMSDPVANKIGSALYGEVSFDGSELELEAKVILDKKFNRNFVAVNLVGAYATEWGLEEENGNVDVEAEKEIEFEFDGGFMHFISDRSAIGFELLNRNEVNSENANKSNNWEFSALYAGPAVHFNGPRWFLNFSVLPQLTNLKKEEGSTNLELIHNEKLRARVLLSFAF